MAVARREVADPQLRLRAIRFVDEDRPAAAAAVRRGSGASGDARAFRQPLDEPLRRAARAVASSTSPARPITRLSATTSRRHSSRAASRPSSPIRASDASVPSDVRPYGWPGLAQPVEPARRERAVVVADLVEHLRRLAQQARVLVVVEPRLGEDVGGEIDRPRPCGASATSPDSASESRDSRRRARRRASRACRRAPRAGGCPRRGARAGRRDDAGPRRRSDRPKRHRGSRPRTTRAACRAKARRSPSRAGFLAAVVVCGLRRRDSRAPRSRSCDAPGPGTCAPRARHRPRSPAASRSAIAVEPCGSRRARSRSGRALRPCHRHRRARVQKSVSASALAFSTSFGGGGCSTRPAISRSIGATISSAPWPRAVVTASRSSDGSRNGVSCASTDDAAS